MKRGDVVTIRDAGTAAGKARPCVIVSRESALPVAAKVTACPLTSHLRGAIGQRPFVAPAAANGLRVPSEVEVDWIFTTPIERLGAVIGRVDVPTLETIDAALRRWLDL